ncbi:MAG: tripartite tricarboxylate transporter substrate binding protein BugE [Pseudomonadota bacterium]
MATTTVGALVAPAVGWAQTYPSRPVRLVVPFAPGGTTDLISRIVSEKLSAVWGQPVVVENRTGGGGTVGSMEVVRSAPDGYTLGMATVSTLATHPAVNPKLPYDPSHDFTPISNLAATPNVLVVHPTFPARSYAAFLQELKRRPGKYSYASSGHGGMSHLQAELFKSLTGTDLLHVPYRGAAPALDDTLAGQVPVMIDNVPTALPFIQEGRLIAMAVSAPQRLNTLPNVPTFKELGLPEVNRLAFYGLVGPRGMPRHIVEKINVAVRRTLEDPGVKRHIEALGCWILGNTPEQFTQQMRAEADAYRLVSKKQNLSF